MGLNPTQLKCYLIDLDLDYFGGHRRYILPPLNLSQRVIADGEIIFFRIDL